MLLIKIEASEKIKLHVQYALFRVDFLTRSYLINHTQFMNRQKNILTRVLRQQYAEAIQSRAIQMTTDPVEYARFGPDLPYHESKSPNIMQSRTGTPSPREQCESVLTQSQAPRQI